MAAATYWTVFGWAVIGVGLAVVAGVWVHLLSDAIGRQTILYLFGSIIGFFAACALVALPIWWLL
jgi:hypothetical protein